MIVSLFNQLEEIFFYFGGGRKLYFNPHLMASPMTSLTSRTVNLSQQLQLQLLVFFVFLVSVAELEPPVLERLWSRFFYLVGAERQSRLLLGGSGTSDFRSRLKMWRLRKTGSCLVIETLLAEQSF